MSRCTADLGHPCDAGGRDEYGDPIGCESCRAIEDDMRREWAVASPEERDPERYRREMIDAGRGHLLGGRA